MSGRRSKNSVLYPLIPRRPAVPLVLLWIAGIIVHPWLPVKPWLWLLTVGLLVASALVNRARPLLASASLALATLIASIAAAQIDATRFDTHHIAAYATDRPRIAQVEVKVEDEPRTLVDEFSHRPLPPRQVFTANVTRVAEWSGWTDAAGRVLVQIDDPHPRLRAGQRLRLLGLLHRPGEALNPGQFDWSRYYRKQRILTALRVRSAGAVEILDAGSPGPLVAVRQAARSALAMGFTSNQRLDHALLRALLLGDNDPLLDDVQEQFIRTGTSHHLAISGMHIAVLGGFIFGVCRVFALAPRLTTMIVCAFVALYGVAALPSPPVLRSVALCLFMGFGLLNRRSLDMLQMLALSALVLLIYSPLDLYNAGFQLSFVTVLGLVLLTGPMTQTLLQPDPYVDALILRRRTRWQVLRDGLKLRCAQITAATLVAWAVSLPLVAVHFERLNPWAMFASIILAPFVFAALILGLLKVVLTLLLPSLAGFWAIVCAWPISLMRTVVDWLAMLPGSDLAFPRPPLALIVVYYVLLCLPLLVIPARMSIWRLARVAPAGVCLLIMCVPLLLGAKAGPVASGLRLTVLAVGAGSCAVLELPDRRTMLFDAGSVTLTDPVDQCIGPFLRHRGINRIDALFLSHANYDHYSAAAELVERYDVRDVYVSPQFIDHSAGNPTAERLLRELTAAGRSPLLLSRGDRLSLGADTSIEVLWPAPDSTFRPNDASLVLRLACGGRSILLPGDIEAAAQQQLLSTGTDLRADVLVAPHHGSFEPTTGRFLRAVGASSIISSNDRSLSLRQKDFEQMVNVPLYRTHRNGAITIEIDESGLAVTPFRTK